MQTWKDFLKEYLAQMNKAEVNEGAIDPASYFWEEADQKGEQAHWASVWAQWRNRDAHPLAAKTNAIPLSVSSVNASMLEAELELHEELHYLHGDVAYRQQNQRIQQVTLEKRGDRWGFAGPWRWSEKRITGQLQKKRREQNSSSKQSSINQPWTIPEALPSRSRSSTYNREQAVAYAETHWDTPNPAYAYLTVDCTNFVSQCLHAGGIPMQYTGNRGSGWWYRGKGENWSYSWTVAHSLYLLMKSGKAPIYAVQMESPMELDIGDVICYDFDGDGRFQHNTLVVGKDIYGMPLVNAHTTNSQHRYWEYRDSTAYTPHIQYAFFKIDAR